MLWLQGAREVMEFRPAGPPVQPGRTPAGFLHGIQFLHQPRRQDAGAEGLFLQRPPEDHLEHLIFSDGIEADYLCFTSGIEARIELAEQWGALIQ